MAGQIIEKALVYATWQKRLLVFVEPDFPELLPLVPGGTIEAGEAADAAATREFFEETGLTAFSSVSFLRSTHYRAQHGGRAIHQHRHFFHLPLKEVPLDTWDHVERHSATSTSAILFRFFWLPYEQARSALGYEMDAAIDRLPT